MIKYMLDTNILIYTIKNRPKKVKEAFKRQSEFLAISAVSVRSGLNWPNRARSSAHTT